MAMADENKRGAYKPLTDRPTCALIDLGALRHNYKRLSDIVADKTAIMAVVKADAYGHGAAAIAPELERQGCRYFAVALATEGAALRDAGITSPILVLGGVFRDDCTLLFEHDLTPVVHNTASAALLDEEARARGIIKPVHLKIDTGMARLGIRTSALTAFLEKFKEMKNLRLEGLFSHFAEADIPDSPFTREQLRAFNSAATLAQSLGFSIKYLHMANSAATARLPESHFNMVRPGIMLYGASPAPDLAEKMDLRPLMTLKTEVLQIQRLPAGRPVSYGRTFVTERDSIMATLPIGYGDGLPRALSNRGHVLIGGTRAPIRGTVCMDLIMCDVTDIPGVRPGDEAVVIGRQGAEEITADEIAGLAGTISYEIFCGVSKRVPRVYR